MESRVCSGRQRHSSFPYQQLRSVLSVNSEDRREDINGATIPKVRASALQIFVGTLCSFPDALCVSSTATTARVTGSGHHPLVSAQSFSKRSGTSLLSHCLVACVTHGKVISIISPVSKYNENSGDAVPRNLPRGLAAHRCQHSRRTLRTLVAISACALTARSTKTVGYARSPNGHPSLCQI